MRTYDYQAFVSMFYALDVAFKKNGTERLRSFLSEANPFLWKDKGSADPAVYEEFSKSFGERFGIQGATPEEARLFVRDYLGIQDNEYCWAEGDFVAAFDSIVTPQLWERSLEETAGR